MNKRHVFPAASVVVGTAFMLLLTLGLAQAQTGSGPDQPVPVDNSAGTNAFADPVDCGLLSAPVIGYEVSRGQSTNDVAGFFTDLAASGYQIGTVNINAGPIPVCVDILIIRGLAGNSVLSAPYTVGDANLLNAWTSSGHGVLIASDWGLFKNDTQALFQVYGYALGGSTAVTDATDSDPGGLNNAWVIYQTDNFAAHPLLAGVTGLEFLYSSWISPAANAVVTTDNDADPAQVPVMTALADNHGCAVLSADSNWFGDFDGGYGKVDNALAARQAVDWLLTCDQLALTKTAGPNPAPPGEWVTYGMTAVNDFATPLTGVIITDTIPAGTTFVSATGAFSGPDANNVVTWNVGTLAVNGTASVEMVVRLSNGLAIGDIITNTAYVHSSEGLGDSATALVTVGVAQLTAVAGGPYTVNEGSSVSLHGSAVGGGPLSYAWDFDNDGLFDDAAGTAPTFSAAVLDDGSYPVALRVSGGSLADTDSTAVTVNNVAPQVTVSANSGHILAGQTVTFTGSFIDPGVLDTHSIVWDMGDASGSTSSSLTQPHLYTKTGVYTITLAVTDDDGGTGQDRFLLRVTELSAQLYLPLVAYNFCQPSATGADVLLLLDTSDSMNQPAEGGGSRLEAARMAAAVFIDLLHFPADQAGIVSFSSAAVLQHPLSTDAASLHSVLPQLTAGGITRIDLALAAGQMEVLGPRHKLASNPVLILLTDGRPHGTTAAAVLNKAAAAKAAGIVIYTIGLGADVDGGLLRAVATSPIHYYQAPTTADLNQIYQQIAGQIHCD